MTPDDKKPQADNLPLDEDQVYDLLVDGELDDDRRRTLLGNLDDKPGGWRRCALAFLEAQSWGKEFRSLSTRLGGTVKEAISTTQNAGTQNAGTQNAGTSPAAKSVPGKKKSSSAKRRRKLDRSGAILGMAASFLLAMGITSLMQDINPSGMLGSPGSMEANLMPPPNIHKSFHPTKDFRIGHLGLNNDITKEMHLMTLTGKDSKGKEHTFGLPAVSQKNLNQQWLKEMPTSIPDGVVESFQRAGHDVKTSRQLIPFTMRNGRKLIIPVDQVNVNYAKTPYYQ